MAMTSYTEHETIYTDKSLYRRAPVFVVMAYLVPVFIYSLYAVRHFSSAASWGILSLGLILSLFGSLLLILLLRHGELFMRRCMEHVQEKKAPSPSLSAENGDEEQLLEHYETQLQELQKVLQETESLCQERELALQQMHEQNEKLQNHSGTLDEQVKCSSSEVEHKDQLLKEYQQTIAEQRSVIEKKQQHILKLENKVQDLNYEVKTLLQLGELSQETDETAKKKTPRIPLSTSLSQSMPG